MEQRESQQPLQTDEPLQKSVRSPAGMPSRLIAPSQIIEIEQLIRPYIRRTPILTVPGEEFGLAAKAVVFKLELFQHAGSFKPRGAFANMLVREVPSVGVVAASGGNHGAAVAYAARILRVPAKIFVPSVATRTKVDLIRRFGADLVIAGELYADALATSEEWASRSGALTIHANDGMETLLGQGTIGMEYEEQCPTLDSLLMAVGGGGLIGGIASWYGAKIKLIGVEPTLAPTMTRALEAGFPVDAPAGGLASDSLAPRRVGKCGLPIVQRYVHDVLLVSDEEIMGAQRLLWEKLRVVVEPGGAAAFAALVSKKYKCQPGERVGVLLCGGNSDAVRFRRAPV